MTHLNRAGRDTKDGDPSVTTSEPLTVTETVRDGCTVITAAGDLDLATHDQLRTALIPALDTARPLIADLSRILFMDSSGLNILIRTHKAATTRDIPIVIIPSPAVSRVLELSQIDKIFTLRPALADALTAAHQPTT